MMSEARRQSRKYKSDVHVSNVITDHQHRAAKSTQVLASNDARPAQQEHRRPLQEVMSHQANPGHWPAQRPARVVILGSRCGLTSKHFLQIADSASGGEICFAQVQL